MSSVNTKQIKIASRYAKALADFDERELILSELEQVSAVFDGAFDLKTFLSNPIVSAEDKKEIIGKVFSDTNEKVLNFLYLLVEKNRFEFFDAILQSLKNILDDKNNVIRAEIVSAVDLTEDEKNTLKDKLQRKFEANIQPEYKINSEIIAGLVIKVKDKVIDNSLKTRLDRLEKQLI